MVTELGHLNITSQDACYSYFNSVFLTFLCASQGYPTPLTLCYLGEQGEF